MHNSDIGVFLIANRSLVVDRLSSSTVGIAIGGAWRPSRYRRKKNSVPMIYQSTPGYVITKLDDGLMCSEDILGPRALPSIQMCHLHYTFLNIESFDIFAGYRTWISVSYT
jgi:hypothetical protein